MPQAESQSGPDYSRHPEYALAALLHMLVRYPMVYCGAMADSIAAHLRLVAEDPRFTAPVREAALQACSEWKAMMEMQTAVARQQRLIN